MSRLQFQRGSGYPGDPVLLILAALIVLLVSCKDEHLGTGGGSGDIPSGWYPMQIGTTWQYDRTVRPENIRIVDSSAYMPLDTTVSELSVTVTRNLRLPSNPLLPGDSIDVVEFRTHFEDQGSEVFDYYEQSSEGLFFHGYDGGGGVTPKLLPSNVTYRFRGIEYSSVGALYASLGIARLTSGGEIVRELPPLIALSYPLESGKSWTYRGDFNPWRIDKTVVAVVDSMIGPGTQRVTVVRWQWDVDHDGVWDDDISMDDFLSPAGLVGRLLELRDVVVTGNSGPDSIAVVDMRYDTVLRR